ncbi:STAS/SEC14 domain-containing protein [Coraliomargarita akajimensis]|uniref:STAS/SEC14 domain-containing protein n=1 Tax=Coraliomargarita akajimensis (strain DSM 45221 / IAM 15411 / JCM 23193 / KCTC 12865 / 04OKA010-24) TaxID=583355 RepID=D5ER41_CORAD|nr:STAS/SEC14 domain-containing protein [Coraliomargarita akajimensis]ADE54034.1 conserved hypothetical protein [Coraliomargarita akajimensis DSM 45221]
MLTTITNLPDNIVGVSATGKVTAQDYERVLIPLIEEKLKRHKKLSCLYQLGPDFEGFEPAALWNDASIGMRHPFSWTRIACVTDVDWIFNTTKAFGFLSAGHMRVFRNAELEAATKWIIEAD